MSKTLTCDKLNELIAADAVVVDVMTPEDYAACHIVGARSACIYEMVFPERMAECAPGLNARIVVYDASGTSRAAELARERLNKSGYSNVSILEGGLSAWRSAGLPVETGDQPVVTEPLLRDGTYGIDIENSRLEWIGRNLNNRHYGRIAIQKGELSITGGVLSGGSLFMDMDSIANLDLQDSGWRNMLISHLKSDDFFAVDRFPTASFQLTGWEPQAAAPLQAPEGVGTGNLTIRDVTRSISFTAIVAPQEDGSVKAHAAFDIDRTLWNVCYGSGRLFERLGMHLVNDIISLELFIVTR